MRGRLTVCERPHRSQGPLAARITGRHRDQGHLVETDGGCQHEGIPGRSLADPQLRVAEIVGSACQAEDLLGRGPVLSAPGDDTDVHATAKSLSALLFPHLVRHRHREGI